MDPVEKILAIEEIKALKAKYFLGIDTQDMRLWREEVFSPDIRLEIVEVGAVLEGVEMVIEWVGQSCTGLTTVHHGHMPIIDVISPTVAKGLWAMEDHLWGAGKTGLPGGANYVHGWGHYHETYSRLDCGWRIQTSKITRLRVERLHFA